MLRFQVTMEDFVENTRKTEDKTSAWHHFLKSKTKSEAKCKYCSKVLLCTGGSTSALRNHLKNKHLVFLESTKTTPQQTEHEQTAPSTSKKSKKITEYLTTSDSMELTVSRMVTLDGIAFRVFANSVDLRRLYKKSNLNLPASANTIKSIVMLYSQKAKQEVICLLAALKRGGKKFSLTADEWVSSRNHRYMNINLHSPDLNNKSHINLGLARLEGSATAIKCADILEKRLQEFDVSLEDDISGLTTDAAAVMVKMGKCLPVHHQLCYAHGIQLAVIDLLYKKHPVHDEEACHVDVVVMEYDNQHQSDSESDDEEDGVTVETENRQQSDISNKNYKDLIQKVRKVVKVFKKSATKNDVMLQKYVKEKFGHDMCVILDCKTRWSSLFSMIERFLVLHDCLQKALLDLKSDIRFTDDEITSLKQLKEALESVKGVVEVLCQENATLLTADTAFKCLFRKLSSCNSRLSCELLSALKKRIGERYLMIQGVLKYLDDASSFFNDESFIFAKPTADFIKEIVSKIAVDADEIAPLALQATVTASAPAFKSFKDELLHALTPAKSCPEPSLIASDLEIEKMVLCEMALHENGGGRGKFLTKAYNALITIKPTSVESERAFSTAGYFCNKIRSRLNDSTLDVLLFLRSYFQRSI